jgi:surface protein
VGGGDEMAIALGFGLGLQYIQGGGAPSLLTLSTNTAGTQITFTFSAPVVADVMPPYLLCNGVLNPSTYVSGSGTATWVYSVENLILEGQQLRLQAERAWKNASGAPVPPTGALHTATTPNTPLVIPKTVGEPVWAEVWAAGNTGATGSAPPGGCYAGGNGEGLFSAASQVVIEFRAYANGSYCGTATESTPSLAAVYAHGSNNAAGTITHPGGRGGTGTRYGGGGGAGPLGAGGNGTVAGVAGSGGAGYPPGGHGGGIFGGIGQMAGVPGGGGSTTGVGFPAGTAGLARVFTGLAVVTNNSTANQFIFTVDTTKAGSASNTFILPLPGSGAYNYTVYWGDGTSNSYSTNTSRTHVYASSGVYTIEIVGTFPQIYFNGGGDCAKLLSVTQLGTVGWTSFSGAFYGCSNLTSFTAGANANTSAVTSCNIMFNSCSSLATANFTGMSTAAVTTMYAMFYGCSSFNQSVASFNTAAVTNMALMFENCSFFNQSVASFNTAAVTNMGAMFANCSRFNQDVSGWNIGVLTTAGSMFNGSGFALTNYNLLLPAWNNQSHQPNVTFSAGSAHYSSGAPTVARAALVADGWTITDGGTP